MQHFALPLHVKFVELRKTHTHTHTSKFILAFVFRELFHLEHNIEGKKAETKNDGVANRSFDFGGDFFSFSFLSQ